MDIKDTITRLTKKKIIRGWIETEAFSLKVIELSNRLPSQTAAVINNMTE